MKAPELFLIIEANRKIKAFRADRLDAAVTRGLLQKMWPGSTVYGPLERPPGPVLVATVYLSRDRQGRGRTSPLEQWGIG